VRKSLAAGLAAIALVVSPFFANAAHAQIGVTGTTLVSATPSGDASDSFNSLSTVTPDGRYVAFVSSSDNMLVNPIATDGGPQVYLYDRQAHHMEMISQALDGSAGAPDASTYPALSISNDGRYVVFNSSATNLAVGQPQPSGVTYNNVFLRDRQTGTTTLISSGTEDMFADGQAISGDGNLIVYSNFNSWVSGGDQSNAQSYVYNRTTGVTTQLPDRAVFPRISYDGQYVTYLGPTTVQQTRPGVVSGLFRYNIATGVAQQFTPTIANETSGAVLTHDSANAVYATTNFQTGVMDLVKTNIATGQTTTLVTNISTNLNLVNEADSVSFSTNDRYMSYKNHTTGNQDFVMDTQSGQRLLAVTASNYRVGTLTLTGDGSELVYETSIQPLINQIYVAKIQQVAPSVPTGLAGTSPTNNPTLTWNAVDGATSYNVYRNGTKVGTATSATFTDTAATDGTYNYTVTAVSSDGLESDQSGPVTIVVDKTAPTVSGPTMSSRLIVFSGNATISAVANDSLSGVVSGEYYIDTDPGQGHATAMTYANGKITATAHITALSPGIHTLYMRAKDAAGNWGTTTSVTFIFV